MNFNLAQKSNKIEIQPKRKTNWNTEQKTWNYYLIKYLTNYVHISQSLLQAEEEKKKKSYFTPSGQL